MLDGSGFAYGDKWGANYAQSRLGFYVSKWVKQKRKIVLLPQAFGPFNDADLKVVMQSIINSATLVFAREDQSLYFLESIVKDNKKIFKFPDFTNLVKGKIPKDFDSNNHQVAIVPNHQMIDSTSLTKSEYLDFLSKAVDLVRSRGLKPFFLIHEGNPDFEIAKAAVNQLTSSISIVKYEDALAIKGIISTCKFIICSRFHGVVSALSQGVPCITTSWSHKYEMLLDEYDMKEALIKNLTDFDSVSALIAEYSDQSAREEVSKKLMAKSHKYKLQTEEMWEMVRAEIVS